MTNREAMLDPKGLEVAASIAKLEKEAAFIIGTPGCREAYAAMTDAITLLSALASRAQTAEAVAAKSREEALEEAQQRLRTMQKTLRDLDINPAYCDGIKNAADFLEPLKSSRTDSGQPPATNSVESGRATEEDGATNSA